MGWEARRTHNVKHLSQPHQRREGKGREGKGGKGREEKRRDRDRENRGWKHATDITSNRFHSTRADSKKTKSYLRHAPMMPEARKTCTYESTLKLKKFADV